MTRGPVVCLFHGGGPMPVLGDPGHKEIIKSMKTRVPDILKIGKPDQPRAIIVVTAHWSESQPTISSGQTHSLLYDYGGFPPESYQLKYDAPGSPEVAAEVKKAFEDVGLSPKMDAKRGWDHGVFIPFLLINPAANIPIVQVSVLSSEDPASHFKMGRALATLRDSNIAILGSGAASFHHLPQMFQLMRGGGDNGPLRVKIAAWNRALTDAVQQEETAKREAALVNWRENLPHSYDMHPRNGAEHFMPLLVCASAGAEGKAKCFKDEFLGIDCVTHYWD